MANPEGINQYSKGGGNGKSSAKSKAKHANPYVAGKRENAAFIKKHGPPRISSLGSNSVGTPFVLAKGKLSIPKTPKGDAIKQYSKMARSRVPEIKEVGTRLLAKLTSSKGKR